MSTFKQFLAASAQQGWPFLFPTLFGNGQDGALTTAGGGSGNQSDVGYLGSFGPKRYTNFTLSAGDTWTVAPGTSSGALIIACQGKLKIAGSIIANGAAGGNGIAGGSGAGGGTAGAGAGAASVTINTAGTQGAVATKYGHGALQFDASTLSTGGNSGGHQNSNAASSNGAVVRFPLLNTGSTLKQGSLLSPIVDNSGLIKFIPYGLGASNTTAAANGTTQPVRESTSNYGPWGQSGQSFFSFGFLPSGPQGEGGGVTGVAGQEASGGGGGGGGAPIYFEADTIELVAGYSIQSKGGNGGNGYSSNGTTAVAGGGTAGCGGPVVLVCRTLIGLTSSIDVSGGTHGTGAGTSAANGLDGIAGGLYVIKV